MFCELCDQHIDLWDLDDEGYYGLPAHKLCADAYRQEVQVVLNAAEAMIMAEPDPRRHRHHLRPPAGTTPA